MTNKSLPMPITVVPYHHQQQAFDFAMKVFGVLQEGGDSNADDSNSLRPVRKEVHEIIDRNA